MIIISDSCTGPNLMSFWSTVHDTFVKHQFWPKYVLLQWLMIVVHPGICREINWLLYTYTDRRSKDTNLRYTKYIGWRLQIVHYHQKVGTLWRSLRKTNHASEYFTFYPQIHGRYIKSVYKFLRHHQIQGSKLQEHRVNYQLKSSPNHVIHSTNTSCLHPYTLHRAFIYGEFLRIIRNLSEEEEYEKTSSFFQERLLLRGYEDFVSDIQWSMSHENRQHILEETGQKPERNKHNNLLVFTTRYTGFILPTDIKSNLFYVVSYSNYHEILQSITW